MPSRRVTTALAALLVLAVPGAARADTAARARAASAACANADAVPGQAPIADVRAATLCLMNAERTARGLRPLRSQPALTQVADRYARQMVRDRFFDHTSPGGATMVSRIKGTSYLHNVLSWTVGENLAWGSGTKATPRATVDAWMHSAGHRANLLDRGFADVGVGVASGAPSELEPDEAGGTYVTDFGRRVRK